MVYARVILNACGVVLIAKGDFGATAVTSVSYVRSLRFASAMGQFAFGVNLAVIAIALSVVFFGRVTGIGVGTE